MISTGWTIGLVVIGVVLIIGAILVILIKKRKIRLHGGYFHIINLDDESVKVLDALLKKIYSPKVIIKRMRATIENKLIEYMRQKELLCEQHVQMNDDTIDALINCYWRDYNKSSETIIENLNRYVEFIDNDLGKLFAAHLKDGNKTAVFDEINKHFENKDIPTDEYMSVYVNLFDKCLEDYKRLQSYDDGTLEINGRLIMSPVDAKPLLDPNAFISSYGINDALYDLFYKADLPDFNPTFLFYDVYDDGGGLTSQGKIFMTMYYKSNPDDFVRDQFRANEMQKDLMNELFEIINELLRTHEPLTVDNIQGTFYNTEYGYDLFDHYGFYGDTLAYVCKECKKTIKTETENAKVVNRIDLSTFKPQDYNPNTWDSDNPYTDDPAKATLIYPEPFSGNEGFQIKNGTKELANVNTITVRSITDPIAKESLEQINKDLSQRLRGIKVSKFSAHIMYDVDREMDPNHTFYAYKGSLGEYVNETKGDIFIPFTLLTAGFELTNLTRGFASTVGMYFSSDIKIATTYGNGGVVYKYNIEYNKYYYSFIRHNISDHVLEFITHNFDKAYIAFPSDRAIKLWCCLQPDYLEEVMDQRYHMTLEQIKQSLIDEYATEYDDKEMEAAFTAERVYLEHAACKTQENAIAREKYYNDRNIDLVISYKHGGDTHDNDHKRKQINHDLIKNVPCYEVILRKGGKVLITDILMMIR